MHNLILQNRGPAKTAHYKYCYYMLISVTDSKSFPATGLDRPLGFLEVEAPEFLDNRHMKVVRLSSPTHRPSLPPGRIPGTHFC
jgi:hypothetical protein